LPGTRQRMISAAMALLERRGLAAMSFSDVVTDSGAARGAIYHHFPGGKLQLAAEAAEATGTHVQGYFAGLSGTTPRAVVEAFLESIRPVIVASTAGGGCAVAAVTVDIGDRDPERTRALQAVAHHAFSSWTAVLTDKLTVAGLTPEGAADLACLLITLLEGAQILCRACGNLEPFDHAAGAILSCVS
jgi:TetR/AcrR family transcriptional regulator, lmrAB and yxaGH operons repressor